MHNHNHAPSTLHLHSLPPTTLLSIDLTSFHTTPQFTGLHSIPPGLHHLFLSPPSSEIRHSQWILVPPGSTSHMEFDANSCRLVPCAERAVDKGGATAYRQRSRVTGGVLGGEEKEGKEPEGAVSTADAEWRALIPHITPKTLDRVFGVAGWCCSSLSGSRAVEDLEAELSKTSDSIPPLKSEEEKMEEDEEEELLFTPIDLKRTWSPDAVGRERTDAARDRSYRLRTVVAACGGAHELLGELEISFVISVLVGSYVAAIQWRRIVEVVLTSKRIATRSTGESIPPSEGWEQDFLVEFFGVLREHLETLRAGYVGDGSFLSFSDMAEVLEQQLRRFNRSLRELEEEGVPVLEKVKREWAVMKKWAEKEMDWVLESRDVLRRGMVMTEEGDMVEVEDEGVDEEEERGEWAPVIVEMDDGDNMEVDEETACFNSGGSRHVPNKLSLAVA
ncbi:hypothetical protein EX30DRAFT_361079 [Ascodesmis nigricans]|uniref:Uncharacterized protein n=1 Tax=Ascodesmis nigricans TaxID=341454 RepID=A0A4S2N7L4_9PEZI|nr:hypothetical protein EX30DRAFT_361079 [Ascodesmis nigricans]